ncbi:MAG: hypothetical protein K1X57_10845 [Gemmataceae bacterium]|nr:hypothetical protein [Gemmataceae bacterium]
MTDLRNIPIQTIAVFLVNDDFAGHENELEATVKELADSRDWVLGRPELELTNDHPDIAEDEDDLTIYRVSIRVYSALPPWDKQLPKETDRLHFEESLALLAWSQLVTKRFRTRADWFLDSKWIGSVINGKADETLQIGLFDEWKRVGGY